MGRKRGRVGGCVREEQVPKRSAYPGFLQRYVSLANSGFIEARHDAGMWSCGLQRIGLDLLFKQDWDRLENGAQH
eukprot:scaffold218619_cov17-Tisochrysis_lutea.AAC.2